MKTHLTTIEVVTKKQFEIVDITNHVAKCIEASGVSEGNVTVYTPHTTASIRINHNEPLLIQDILKALYRLAPVDISYSHDLFELRQSIEPTERSNGHAHVKAFLLGASSVVIVHQGKPLLGAKQSIFLVECDGGRRRTVHIQIIGE